MTDHKDRIPPGKQKPAHSEKPHHKPTDKKAEQPAQESKEEESMEVHHHAHHSGPKNWKSYIREFLMLFLAVLCGFLAEYQLEHTVEHDREEQYIESMIADMREDSSKITSNLNVINRQLAGMDSLLENIYQRPYTDSSLKRMYYIQLVHTHNRNSVHFTKRTITQLQNSGGLRLIRNKPVSDSIIFYSEYCEYAESQAAYIETVRMGKIADYALKLFDNQYILDSKGRIRPDFFSNNSTISLLTDDDRTIKEYANAITYARGSLRNYTLMLKGIQASIPSKMKFLEESYR